ncbi:MAG TPA: baseplate J/gp47 family protein [Saprospiraceae bacterium]|nr:baseplate J/gp47 family protein [Saprospiraceae bacterium]
MAFEPKKFSELFDTMRGRSTAFTDFEVGSVTRTLVESFAFELSALYEKMKLVYLAGFVDTAEGIQLDQVVAVLGITRNLPDYAEGEVTFTRDTGSSDILIPAGTLVATEDSEEKPKKTYKTLEEKIMAASENEANVKIIAFERGDQEVTAAGTIIVMPRPIPGIKAVSNAEATRFLGKRRETDEQLRNRAKNALFQSGKATIGAIRNVLLSQPGIKDVLIKENFHFAKGKVVLSRIATNAAFTLPKGTVIQATSGAGAGTIKLRLLEEAIWAIGDKQTIPIEAESPTAGIEGEIISLGVYNIAVSPNTLEGIKIEEAIALDEYGFFHAIIDGPDVEGNKDKRQEILTLIEQWRAAGIYVVLKNVQKTKFGGIFRIALDPALKLKPEERRAYELEVEAAIRLHIDSLAIGETLKFPKLLQQVLATDGIDTIEQLRIITTRTLKNQDVVSIQYGLADNQITIGEEGRFDPGDAGDPEEIAYISVASEEKELPFDLEFKSNTTPDIQTLTDSATNYLTGSGDKTIEDLIAALGSSTIEGSTFKIKAFPWSPRPVIQLVNKNDSTKGAIDISFVEKPIVRNMFAYTDYLDIFGALKVSFPGFYKQSEKDEKIKLIRADLNAYIDSLAPEEVVVIPTLAQIAKQTTGVLDASVKASDFQVLLNQVKDDTRIKPDDSIQVKAFEKARLAPYVPPPPYKPLSPGFCITDKIETMSLAQTQLEIKVAAAMPQADRNTIATKLMDVFNAFTFTQGEKIIFNNLKAQLESAAPSLIFTISKLAFIATSLCDLRIQESGLGNPVDIHVRSVELPVIEKITVNDIIVTTT